MEKKTYKSHNSHKSLGTNTVGSISQASSYQTVFSSMPPTHVHTSKRRHSTSSHHSSSPNQKITGNNNVAKYENGIVVAPPKHPSMFQNLQVVKTQATAPRNKNEEAINELRMRIPEIEKIFDIHNRIGNGTFSTVLLGTLKKERGLSDNMRRKFAIKHHIPTSHPERIMKELQCMAKIGGTDNVVGINCCIRYNESVAFIMPYLQHDRFHDFYGKMDLEELQFYMKNLLIALRHVHKFNVIHRDVKPSNFLYNRRKRQFLLVDFGLAQHVVTTSSSNLNNNNSINSNNNNNNNAAIQNDAYLPLPPASGTGNEKRTRDDEGTTNDNQLKSAKRLRYAGPQGDQEVSSQTSVQNSNASGKDNAFKMPLKQLNEITPGKQGSNSSTLSQNSGAYDSANTRQIKSGNVHVSAASTRLNSRTRQGGNNATTTATGTAPTGSTATGDGATVAIHPGNELEVINDPNNSKNTGNRSMVQSNAKCHCYGNPQVCNICLIKKEIHASRAGTPGYRPPEVLLKYPDQTTAVDMWAVGVIFLSVLSSVYPFFKAPNDYVALAEMVTIFGDKTIRKTAFLLDRLVTLSQKTKPLDLRKLCVRFRNRIKFSSPELLTKYQSANGTCEVCKNCDQFFFNCLCADSHYKTEPFDEDDPFPDSAYDLLYKLLEVNPHKRITAAEALNHPFFHEKSTKAQIRSQIKKNVPDY